MKASRWIVVAVAALALVGLFLVLRPKGDEPAPSDDASVAPVSIAITVSGGEVSGVEDVTAVPFGSPVTIEVTSDSDGSAHLHGYEVIVETRPDAPSVIEFTADRAGRFDLMFHDASGETRLTQLEVSP